MTKRSSCIINFHLIGIREEISEIEKGVMDQKINPLKMAPHTMASVLSDGWDKPYSRAKAAFPLVSIRLSHRL